MEKWCQLFSVQCNVGRRYTDKRLRMLESLILVGALFLFDEGRRSKGEKRERNQDRGGGLPKAGCALLAVPRVSAVRCN
jgi:hypothetical protein